MNLRIHPLVAAIMAASSMSVFGATDTELPAMTVKSSAQNSYQPEQATSPKYTESLRDTPQTMTVLSKDVIADQNLLSLRDILSTVPGITFGAGEGGGGFGDKITIRGFSSDNDVSIDGLRDSAQYSRTDPFNLESVEVVKGSSSVYAGSGAVGGTVNLVSKMPKNKNFVELNVGVGTDGYLRTTVDANRKINDSMAVRVNIMTHQNDAPGRDVERFERWGIAPSIIFGMNTPTRLTLGYFHQSDDNVPQYGVPFYNGRPLPSVDPSNYYGYSNTDTQQIESDALTAIFDHVFNDSLSMRNATKLSRTEQYTVVDPPQGTWCLPEGKPEAWSQKVSGGAIVENTTGYASSCGTVYSKTNAATKAPNYIYGDGAKLLAGQYVVSGPRGNVRDTTNTAMVNQTDFTWSLNTAGIEHTVVTGFSFSHEEYEFSGYRLFKQANGWDFSAPESYDSPNGYLPVMDIARPDTIYRGPINKTLTGKNSAELDNHALYVFDTLKFNEQWWLNLGVRYDHSEGANTTYGIDSYSAPSATNWNPAQPAQAGVLNSGKDVTADYSVDLLSYKAGVIFKPVEAGTIYLSYANAQTPSVSTVNGTCTTVSAVTLGVVQNNATCNVEPETAITYELGTKWDVLKQKLSVNAALFRTARSNYKVSDVGNPNNPSGSQPLDGKSRVEGIELGAGGLLSHQWSIFANLTLQQSEVLQGAGDFAANGGVSGTEQDWTKGDPLTNVPEVAASFWTTYDWTPKFQLGYGFTYQGELTLTQHTGIADGTKFVGRSTIPLVTSEAFIVHNLSATYKLTRALSVQLNVKNLLDEEYYTRIRNNGWATPGDTRSATVNVSYKK